MNYRAGEPRKWDLTYVEWQCLGQEMLLPALACVVIAEDSALRRWKTLDVNPIQGPLGIQITGIACQEANTPPQTGGGKCGVSGSAYRAETIMIVKSQVPSNHEIGY